ncbi:MAG: hypothetical protein D6769_03460 [Methanobacteriota archaeon]|nr:MAG: hypothetical protein D6769_03460 [Euryarchaeota archaeon]
MIVGDRVNAIEAEIKNREANTGMNIGMKIVDVKEKDGNVEYDYEYTVDYGEAGSIKIRGTIIGRDEPKETLESWKKDKKLSKEDTERLVNLINYLGSVHGTLVARVLSYRPPLVPPRLSVQQKKE